MKVPDIGGAVQSGRRDQALARCSPAHGMGCLYGPPSRAGVMPHGPAGPSRCHSRSTDQRSGPTTGDQAAKSARPRALPPPIRQRVMLALAGGSAANAAARWSRKPVTWLRPAASTSRRSRAGESGARISATSAHTPRSFRTSSHRFSSPPCRVVTQSRRPGLRPDWRIPGADRSG